MANERPFENIEIPPIFKKIFNNRKAVIIGIAVILLFSKSFFQVDTKEEGVITRFGEYSRTVEPGLSLKIPFVEKVYKVPVEIQQKLEFGFETTKAGINSQYRRTPEHLSVSLMLTGDLNLADVGWVVQYRIDNAYNYLFKVRETKSTLRDVSEAAVRQIVGDRSVDEVITIGRKEIEIQLEELIQDICREYSMGVKIDQVVLQNVNPPEPVRDAFNAVNEAEQERETLINEAKAQYNKVIPKAGGQALETIQKAEGYAAERVNRAEGEVARFNDLYEEYIKAPEVTKKRIYLETLQEVLPKLGNKIITDDKGGNVLPLLQMQLDKKVQ